MQIISMCQPTIRPHLHPTNITQTVNIFSVSVLGATFPNPTEVNEVKVKYSAVMYRDCGRQGRQRARVRDARLTMIFRSSGKEYLYGGPSCAIGHVLLMGVRGQLVQPADLTIQNRPFRVTNGVPGNRRGRDGRIENQEPISQPTGTYHMQASQCAMRTNVDMSSTRTAAPYSE